MLEGSLVDKIPLINPVPSFTQKNLLKSIEIINYYVNLCSLPHRVVSRKYPYCIAGAQFQLILLSWLTQYFLPFSFVLKLICILSIFFHSIKFLKGNIKQPNYRLSSPVQFTDFQIVGNYKSFFP